jgi:hypothetical protein
MQASARELCVSCGRQAAIRSPFCTMGIERKRPRKGPFFLSLVEAAGIELDYCSGLQCSVARPTSPLPPFLPLNLAGRPLP